VVTGAGGPVLVAARGDARKLPRDRSGGVQVNLSSDTILMLVIAAPFVAAAVAPLLQRAIGWLTGWALAAVAAAIAIWLWTFLGDVAGGGTVRAAVEWVPSLGLELTFLIDGLSLTFAVLIAGIGALILGYSAAYLRGHEHQGRFLAFLMLFLGAMLGLVLADSLVALYAFWELTTITSFLLIGFDHTRQVARRAAIQAVVVTGIGGLALIAGSVLLFLAFGSWDLSALRDADVAASAVYLPVLVLFLLAAFTKSAQVPFHFWLPNAMEAPTPVSAFLHSATMVQAGVYLVARMTPSLGGTPQWAWTLIVFGGATLIWGSIGALRQTDLKQMLAQTTVASLGLLMLLLGVGSQVAVIAAVTYFVAHALYKAALFLVTGAIDNETGIRDITALGGLREKMAASFIAAVLAGISMVGLPPAIGYLAKDEAYVALMSGDWRDVAVLVVLLAGNAALAGIAFALMIKPFMGALVPTPKTPHEGPVSMLIGPIVLAVLGLIAGWWFGWLGTSIVAPAASAITGEAVEFHGGWSFDLTSVVLWLSVLTWVLGGLVFWQIDRARTLIRRGRELVGWTFDTGFDQAMFGLIRLAGAVTRALHHGRLEIYLVTIFAMLALALLVPVLALGRGLPWLPGVPDLTFYEWGVVALTAIGIFAVLLARTRLVAIVSLGIQGLGVALLYMLFGAPDLSFTQFMIEILSVVILTLVMTRLPLDTGDHREFEDLIRDGGLALLCGVGVVVLLFAILGEPFDPRIGEFYAATSVPLAHGHNIVNVVLVDFRGLDTLGEITVVMAAGVAILALLRRRRAA
jgi:multicomponent Na+:H+ antiporter subunit A